MSLNLQQFISRLNVRVRHGALNRRETIQVERKFEWPSNFTGSQPPVLHYYDGKIHLISHREHEYNS